MKIFFLTLCLIACFSSYSQNYFKVTSVSFYFNEPPKFIGTKPTKEIGIGLFRNSTKNRDSAIKMPRKYFRIALATDSTNSTNNNYPFVFPLGIDTVKAIEELLAFEGDTRFCSHPIQCYNPAVSQIYNGKEKFCSIQVEALFLINQLVIKNPFNYSPFPVLENKYTSNLEAISGIEIKEAFRSYRDWLTLLKKQGLNLMRKADSMPLEKSFVTWY